jgi:uncharacterized protein YbjT (DUF2867 family)
MAILVTGATGTIGTQIVSALSARGAEVLALVRDPAKARLPQGITPVAGEFLDVGAMRAALGRARTLFLLNAVTPDELTQALIALNLAREAGIERVVYLSVIHSDRFTNVPHFTSKFSAERMIEQFGMPATILRPAYFMQNDASLKEAVLGHGVYPMPVGNTGAQMVDARDLGEIAALHLLKRDQAAGPLPAEVVDVVGPEPLTGPALAGIWSETLGRPVAYAGDDVAAFEQQLAQRAPGWVAFDMRQMVARIQSDGMLAPGQAEKLATLLGRPLRTYRDFAAETARGWQQA